MLLRMGALHYESETYAFDDRTLAHLKTAITYKLRRRESFLVSWEIDASVGSGRRSIWLSPNIPISYQFHGSRRPTLNPVWIKALLDNSHSPRGLVLLAEHEAGHTRL